MNRVAWLTCALLSVAGARVYERCELARELSALGVRPDHISTWVCIAYHESRFDTNANNPYSGDHGIFQISELYWCGPGKACGLPCSALRDDDISNDLDCALIVHEEHTRLQGNGFLAWVVYPQHCKHNTKKYLVDCDINAKNSVPITRSRGFQYANSYNQPNDTTDRQTVENLLPPYLLIESFVRENYDKVLDQNRGRTDWYNYKIDNIDDLKLPVFNQPSQHLSMPPTTSAPRRTTPTTTTAPRRTTTVTTTTTEYIPPVKVWRVIETNQFRKKQKFSETTTQKTITKKEYATELERYKQRTKASTAIQLPSTTIRPLSIATTTLPPKAITKSLRPTTKTTVTATSYRSPTSTFTYRPPSSTTTYRPPTSSTTYRSPTSTTTYKPFTWTTTYKPFTWTTTYKPISTTLSTYSTTTRKPSTTSVAPKTVTTTYRPSTTTTIKPSTTTTTRRPTTSWTWSSTTSKTPTVTSKVVTIKPKTEFSWYTFTSRTATTPVTTKLQPFGQTRTTQPFVFSTKVQNNAQTRTTQAVTYSTTNKPQTTTSKPQTTTQKPRTTQSIFDLYLNPTKAPQLPSYKYSWGQSKLKIFAGGTTTTPAPVQSTRGRGENNNGAANKLYQKTNLTYIL